MSVEKGPKISQQKEKYSSALKKILRKVPEDSQEILYRDRISRERTIPLALPVKIDLNTNSSDAHHNMAQLYLFSDMTLAEIGKLYGLTKQNAQQQIKKGLKDIDLVSKEVLKGSRKKVIDSTISLFDYPNRELPTRGPTIKILEALKKGESLDAIRKNFSTGQIFFARRVFEKRSDIPEEFAEKLRINRRPSREMDIFKQVGKDREKAKKILKKTKRSYHTYIKKGPEGKPAFTNISSIVQEAGLTIAPAKGELEFIFNYLKSVGLPVEKIQVVKKNNGKIIEQNYKFTLTSCKEEMIQALREAEGETFDRMREPAVEVIGEAPSNFQIPTTYRLIRRESYSFLFAVLGGEGIRSSNDLAKLGISIPQLAEEAGIPILLMSCNDRFFVADKHKKKLGRALRRILRAKQQSVA